MPRRIIPDHHSLTDAVYTRLLERFGYWVTAHDLAQVGGFCAWRTRISDARRLAEKKDLAIEWNGDVKASAYRLVPKPIGRHAEQHIAQKTLFSL